MGTLRLLYRAPMTRDILKRGGRVDAALGALSYPIYIVHYAVYPPLAAAVPWLMFNLAVVVLIAIALDFMVGRPIDRLRVGFGARVHRPAITQTRIMVRVG